MLKTRIPFLALAFGLLVAACATNPDVSGELDAQAERLAQLEQELDEIRAALREMEASESTEAEHEQDEGEEHEGEEATHASAFELAIAQYIIDKAGFHGIEQALTESGEIDPGTISTVSQVSRILASTQWPLDLSDRAANALEKLAEFHSSLAEDDFERATSLAAEVHDQQHDLSVAIGEWLSGESANHEEHEGG